MDFVIKFMDSQLIKSICVEDDRSLQSKLKRSLLGTHQNSMSWIMNWWEFISRNNLAPSRNVSMLNNSICSQCEYGEREKLHSNECVNCVTFSHNETIEGNFFAPNKLKWAHLRNKKTIVSLRSEMNGLMDFFSRCRCHPFQAKNYALQITFKQRSIWIRWRELCNRIC